MPIQCRYSRTRGRPLRTPLLSANQAHLNSIAVGTTFKLAPSRAHTRHTAPLSLSHAQARGTYGGVRREGSDGMACVYLGFAVSRRLHVHAAPGYDGRFRARARGAITLYVLMCCEVLVNLLVKCSFLGGGGGNVLRLPNRVPAAGGVANCSCARSPERPPRTRAPRGGDHSVSEVARWSHVLRNLARGAADVRPPEPGVAGDARGSRGSRA